MRIIAQVEFIKWDTDGAVPPSDHQLITVDVDQDATEDDISEAVSDKLSEDFGFCHKGFAMVIIDRLVQTKVQMDLWTSVFEGQDTPLRWNWRELLDLGPDEEVIVRAQGDY